MPLATTIVADDRELEPLRDDDEDDSAGEPARYPKRKELVVIEGQRPA